MGLSTEGEVVPQKRVHLDNACSDVLAMWQFCGHSRIGPGREEKLGRQSETVGRGGRCSPSFPLLFGSSFYLFRYKVHSPLTLASYPYCLYHELPLADAASKHLLF